MEKKKISLPKWQTDFQYIKRYGLINCQFLAFDFFSKVESSQLAGVEFAV